MDYHGKIMNIRADYPDSADPVAGMQNYKIGHRDARHAAAEIANEADQEIAAKDQRIKELEEALREAKQELGEIAEEQGMEPYNNPRINQALANRD